MPGSKRTFTYHLIPPPDEAAQVLAKAQRVMGWACDGDPHVDCHSVTGDALGIVTLNMTIHGRDRWWTTQLAQDILDKILWAIDSKGTRLQLDSERQAPHTNRGYGHGRTKTWRERPVA